MQPLALDSRIAVVAGQIDDPFPGDPSDRMIYATAVTHRARLVTKDRRLCEADPTLTAW